MEAEFDAIVLGGGPGGYVCAIRLGQLGQRVACVEAEEYGGVCLNWGCIPSKALISNAHLYGSAKSAANRGLDFGAIEVDPGAMQAWKDGIVKKLTGGVRGLLKANGVQMIAGRGRLAARDTIEVTAADGQQSQLRAAKAIVLATGSETIQIPAFPFDGESIIGARQAVSLKQIPRRLCVIGGGVIGLELGMVYQKFGAELTVIELTDQLLPGIDTDAVKVVERRVVKQGGKVHKGTKAEGFKRLDDGSVVVEVSRGEERLHVECDVLLVAVGMRPRSADLGLEALGVNVDGRGFVTTDDQCRTNEPGIYAIGDVSGQPMLAHKASKEGEVCAEVIAGHPAAKDWVTVPGIVFTDPEVATVGLTDVQAEQQGFDVSVGRFPFSALGRAMSIGETEGFVKVVTDRVSKRVLGIHICGPSASDLISEAALALEMVASAEDLALTIHPHPTLGEALMEASAASLGKAVHMVNR